MPDDLIFRHRQRLKHHFVNTSKVLLYGYHKLSDAAKITYQVIDGFDWEDKTTCESKGYAFPATETIAEIRGISVRTVQRHITELEEAGLLTRTRRKHKASVLYIEDVSQAEVERYLARFVDKAPAKQAPADDGEGSDERNVQQGRGVPPERKARWDYLAQTLAQEFDDPGGLGCYPRIADKLPESVIYRLKAEVKETAQLGEIRSSSAALFVSAAKRYAREHNIALGFTKPAHSRQHDQPLAAGPGG